jgi:voltage-gated potassium channel
MGLIGSNVAHELAITGRRFVMVDRDISNLEHYVAQYPSQLYVLGDATDNEVLLAAGIKHAAGIFAVAHEDNQNLVISLSVKQINPDVRVIARCHDVKNVSKIKSAGADEIVLPDFAGGQRIVSAMVRPNVSNFLDEMSKAEGDLRMEEVVIPGRLHGKSLDIFYEGNVDCLVMAVHHQGTWHFKPTADYLLHGGDILMVMATSLARARMENLTQG